MSAEEVVRLGQPDAVAEALASRLTERLAAIQNDGRVPQVCLTGGRIATAAYRHLAAEGARSAVDWSAVAFWWGDERFVDRDSDDRNGEPVLAVLTASLPLDPEKVHVMPSSDGGRDLDEAAAAYAAELGETTFDVCLLGMGPDGHVASLFPDHDWAQGGETVIGVRDSPKPPPLRISLTMPVINASSEVWFCVTGEDKSAALAQAMTRTSDLPAGSARGRDRTVWLTDAAASAGLDQE